MHHPRQDSTCHGLCTPVVEHWLEREIGQWVHHEGYGNSSNFTFTNYIAQKSWKLWKFSCIQFLHVKNSKNTLVPRVPGISCHRLPRKLCRNDLNINQRIIYGDQLVQVNLSQAVEIVSKEWKWVGYSFKQAVMQNILYQTAMSALFYFLHTSNNFLKHCLKMYHQNYF